MSVAANRRRMDAMLSLTQIRIKINPFPRPPRGPRVRLA
jgi:hypothetical protein